MGSRYDWMYELRPIPIRDKVVEELAKHIAGELAAWPPRILEWSSATDERRFAPLYAEPARPPDAVFRYAFHLTRLELQNDFEAVDYEMRNEVWRAHAKSQTEYECLQLLVRWLTDLLLAAREHSGQALRRADLVAAVDAVEARLVPPLLVTPGA